MPKNIEQKGGESKEGRKQEIRKLGFSDEEAVEHLTKHFTIDKLKEKIQSLQSAGFNNPTALIEKHPPIAGLDINRVIKDLQSVGFVNPTALIEKHPQIAGYDINRVIKDLQSVGFNNPTALIEKFPQIAGYDINRVKRKLQLIQRLNTKFQLQLNPVEIIENSPRYLSCALKRIFFYLRIARFYNVDEKFYRRLIKNNPSIVFVLLYKLYVKNQISNKDELKKLFYKINKIPKQKKQKIKNIIEQKRHIITKNLERKLKQRPNDKNVKFLLQLASNL